VKKRASERASELGREHCRRDQEEMKAVAKIVGDNDKKKLFLFQTSLNITRECYHDLEVYLS
jgi:hypothetical protein